MELEAVGWSWRWSGIDSVMVKQSWRQSIVRQSGGAGGEWLDGDLARQSSLKFLIFNFSFKWVTKLVWLIFF